MKQILAVIVMLASVSGFAQDFGKSKMVFIPDSDFEILNTEVTQRFYESVMGENPSSFKGENNPVECVSWYDAIYFCNLLSVKRGLTPVYAVDGSTDISAWNYIPHKENSIHGEITQNTKANGFRLPTREEWRKAANGRENYAYAGSNDLDEVAWYINNSGDVTHPVALKKPNAYGLYDMSGNVWEWVWEPYNSFRTICGGSWRSYDDSCDIESAGVSYANKQFNGFRIVRTVK